MNKITSWNDVFKLKESKPTSVGNLPQKKAAPSGGFDTSFWMWASDIPNTSATNAPVPAPVVSQAPQTVDQAVTQIILDNPGISAATLVNTLKQQGFEIVKIEIEKEADSAPSQATGIIAGDKKESAKPVTTRLHKLQEFNFKIKETTINDGVGPTKFKVALIEEGLGNLKDAFYYTKEAIQSGVTLFEGKKMYADHPDSIGEQTRPERSIRDIVGNFEALKVEEAKDGRTCLVGCATMIGDQSYSWARSLMRQAVALGPKFPDKQFVGLSINASGEADEMTWEDFLATVPVPESAMPKIKSAMEAGVPMVRVVRALKDAISCDLVTEPGAGGKPLQIIENNKKPSKEAMSMLIKNKEAEEGKKEEGEEAKKEAGAEEVPAKKEAKEDEGAADDKAAPKDDGEGDQDVMLDMLKKHGALAEAMDESAIGMAKQAFEAYKEMGMDEAEAYKCAASSLRLAKHMQGKAGAPEAAPQESKGDAKDPSQLEGSSKVGDKGLEYSEGSSKVDDKGLQYAEATKTIATLQGKIAKLTERIAAFECSAHLEKALKESGLPNSATKSFKENNKGLKTVESIDKALSDYVKGYKEAQSGMGNGFFGVLEKTVESGTPTAGTSFLRD